MITLLQDVSFRFSSDGEERKLAFDITAAPIDVTVGNRPLMVSEMKVDGENTTAAVTIRGHRAYIEFEKSPEPGYHEAIMTIHYAGLPV